MAALLLRRISLFAATTSTALHSGTAAALTPECAAESGGKPEAGSRLDAPSSALLQLHSAWQPRSVVLPHEERWNPGVAHHDSATDLHRPQHRAHSEQPLRVIWTCVVSLDTKCSVESTLELLEMYLVAVRSLHDRGNQAIFAPHLLVHFPPEEGFEHLDPKIRASLHALERLGVSLLSFTSSFYHAYGDASIDFAKEQYEWSLEFEANETGRRPILPTARGFQEYLKAAEQNANTLWQCAVGTYARMDVPNVLTYYDAFSKGPFNSTHVLHTDMDVLWMTPVSFQDWFHMAPEGGCASAMAWDIFSERDFDEDPAKKTRNGGVIVFDVAAFSALTPSLLHVAVQFKFHLMAYDQTLMNFVFRFGEEAAPMCISSLSAAWNFKPWWGPSVLETIPAGHMVQVRPRLIHLQGLHPSDGLLCFALGKASDCDGVNASVGMMSGAEFVQEQIAEQYHNNGVSTLRMALKYYYELQGVTADDGLALFKSKHCMDV